jgi:hypothetical protein
MAQLTYEDYRQRISIQEVLQDAGYRLNRRDGLRYPSYVRIGEDGRRVRGDKFIVTANGMCCFQPPHQRTYGIIGFIKEHPHMFAEYRHGMSPDHLVNAVCRRLLNMPAEVRSERVIEPLRDRKPFDLGTYELHRFDASDFESQKPFYPYFKPRGIDLSTQRAFADHILIATRTAENGRRYSNLSFPLRIPGDDTIVGFEERSRPNAEGKTAYKGKAAGSNAARGVWIANLSGTPIQDARRVLWFESAYDAMAYHSLHRDDPSARHGVYISTGGSPGIEQFRGVLSTATKAEHLLCFDNDEAGQTFAANFVKVRDTMGLSHVPTYVEHAAAGYKDWNDQLMAQTDRHSEQRQPQQETTRHRGPVR